MIKKNKAAKRKFLLVSPMTDIGGFLPLNISLITALLEEAGYEIRLFETTYYRIPELEGQRQLATDIGMFKPVNWDGYGMDKLKDDYAGDFKKLVKEFSPDFIGVSLFTSYNASLGMSFLDCLDKDFKGKVIVGGLHALVSLEEIKSHPGVSAVIIGECEDMLLDALDLLSGDMKKTERGVPNLVYRDKNNHWIDSGKRIISKLDKIPFLNWDYFDDRNFYRPFDGKILRMGHIEMARGCPFKCTYCINEHFYKQFPKFWRVKSVDRILEELNFLKQGYKLDAVKIWDDNLLAMNVKKIAAVTAGLKRLDLKFLCHSRPEHVTEEKARILSQNGCIQIGIGVECGNNEYRNRMLGRKMTDQQIINAFKLCTKYKITGSAYCMLGMPDETREDILCSARLLRRANPTRIVHAIYVPYKGNTLYGYAKEKGYIKRHIDYQSQTKCYLDMPSIRPEEVERLFKTFVFYCRFDDSLYPLIEKAENEEDVFQKLKEMLYRYQFDS